MVRYLLPCFFTLLNLAFAGCDKTTQPSTQPAGPQPQSLPTIQMKLGQKTFTLEVANTPQTEEIGLMYRDFMPADHGMIFVFPGEQERDFWMENTRIPLDILFLTNSGKVVSISSMKAFDRSITPSRGAAKYAIELNVNVAATTGLQPGDSVQLPDDLNKGP